MNQHILVVPYDPKWEQEFQAIAKPIRQVLGGTALRIDHIGSTAVPNLASKPVIDIMIAVADFEPFDAIQTPLESLGYRWRPDNPDLSKRYFREPLDVRRIHIHVHRHGSWGQQFQLLFRDYLRANEDELLQYEEVKIVMAERHRDDRMAYVNSKSDVIWEIMRRASQWVQDTGWVTPPSDA